MKPLQLTLENVHRRFGNKQVLAGFSHTFPLRGVVALMGPSGCGKTTLLRLIAGLERPDAGRIILPPEAKLSMVFQEDRLLPTLSARENLMAVLGERSAESIHRADYCLRRCGLSTEGNHYPAELSGGMKRRIAIARAMAVVLFRGGEILLLDEPFKGLDEKTRDMVQEFVLGEERRGRLTLMVTHSPEEAARADLTLRLDGPPLEIIE